MLTVGGYELDPALNYERDSNLWVAELGGDRVRIGYDPLGAEAAGDVVAISFAPLGTRLARGDALATVEAAKFVGPLAAPVGGCLVAVNEAVLRAPGAVGVDPFGAWLAELDGVPSRDLDELVSGEPAIAAWFTQALARLRADGVVAQ